MRMMITVAISVIALWSQDGAIAHRIANAIMAHLYNTTVTCEFSRVQADAIASALYAFADLIDHIGVAIASVGGL